MADAGYSLTPQNKKLGLTPGITAALDLAPSDWSLEEQPEGVAWTTDAGAPADVILAFFASKSELPDRLPALAQRIFPAGALWIAWPRKAAGHASDLGDTTVRNAVLDLGLVDTKVAAIDVDWSGLKIVWRLANR